MPEAKIIHPFFLCHVGTEEVHTLVFRITMFSKLKLDSMSSPLPPIRFKVESLGGPYRAYKERLRTVPHASTLSLSRKKPMQPTQPACRTPDIRGRVQAGMSPLEALAKVRTRRDGPLRKP